jgi:pseudouridine-5'-phosphate glycosidase
MATPTTVLQQACDSGVSCLIPRDLLIFIAQSLSNGLTASQILANACVTGIACLERRDLLIVIAQMLNGGTTPACTISPDSLPDGDEAVFYDQQLTTDVPATFAVIAGSLPTGVTLDVDGHLVGTPNTPGTFNFTVEATPT